MGELARKSEDCEHYPVALAVNKSPAVSNILSPRLDKTLRENRGSVNRLGGRFH